MVELDLGQRVVAEVYRTMQIDAEWSVRHARGFTWWGHRLAQRVWAEPARQDQEMQITALHAETAVVRGVSEGPATYEALNTLNGWPSMRAAVLDPSRGRLVFHTSMYLYEALEPAIAMSFCHAVALQVAEAECVAEQVADRLGATIDGTAHPVSGIRPDPDSMLRVVGDCIIPCGQGPSPWSEDELAAVAALTPNPAVAVSAGPNGLTAEFAFYGDPPAAASTLNRAPAPTAMFRVQTAPRDPQLGSGCLLRLFLPPMESSARTAAALTRAEATTWCSLNLLGGWCYEQGRLVFGTFLPSFTYRPGLLSILYWHAYGRSQWAATELGVRTAG
jgi:hypothetical protein